MKTKIWRSFGGARQEIAGTPEMLARTRRWLGDSGWYPGAAPPGALKITLGPQLHDAESETFVELEYRCSHHALARYRGPGAMHGATLVGRTGTVLLVGRHASGKTTLALAMRERGFDLHADDVALLSAKGRVVPLGRPLRVRSPSMDLLGSLGQSLSRRALFDASRRVYYLGVLAPARKKGASTRTARTVLPSVRHVVFACYRPGATLALEEMGASTALTMALSHTFSVKPRDARLADAVISLLLSARSWRFTYSVPPRDAAAYLSAGLEKGS